MSSAQHPPIIDVGHAARHVGQHRLNDVPFGVDDFVAHDSQLSFWERDHGRSPPTNCLMEGAAYPCCFAATTGKNRLTTFFLALRPAHAERPIGNGALG